MWAQARARRGGSGSMDRIRQTSAELYGRCDRRGGQCRITKAARAALPVARFRTSSGLPHTPLSLFPLCARHSYPLSPVSLVLCQTCVENVMYVIFSAPFPSSPSSSRPSPSNRQCHFCNLHSSMDSRHEEGPNELNTRTSLEHEENLSLCQYLTPNGQVNKQCIVFSRPK